MSIKEKDLIRELSIFYTDCKEDTAYPRIIKFLEESGLKIERPDLLKQIEEFELEEYDCWIAQDYKEAMYIASRTESLKTAEMYKVEDVDEKIAMYDKLIEKMKNCYNCNALDEEDDTCDITDKCHNYSLWKLKK